MRRSLSRRAVLAGAAAVAIHKANSEERMTHIALLGDSVIDNAAYVGRGLDVAEQLKIVIPKAWKVTRLALDGAITSGVLRQLDELPVDATHLVISAGGNDALGASSIMEASARSVAEVLARLAEIQDAFKASFAGMLHAAMRRKLPTAVCTIYDPRFPDPLRRRLGSLALSIVNDVITREVFISGGTLLDLRVMFNDDKDFANAIEPSAHGGMKLARAIHRFALGLASDAAVLR